MQLIERCNGITFDFYTGLPHMKRMMFHKQLVSEHYLCLGTIIQIGCELPDTGPMFAVILCSGTFWGANANVMYVNLL